MSDLARTRWWSLLGLSALSGLLVFFSNPPFHAWPLMMVALVPWLVGLARMCASWVAALAAGAFVGLVCFLPLAFFVLEFPLLMGGGLALYLSVLMSLFSVGAWLVRGWPPVAGALGVAAVAVMVEWVDFTLVPMFGTAQSFVRVLSAAPGAIQFLSVTGLLGLVFAVVAFQALLVDLFLHPKQRLKSVAALAVLVVAVAAFDLVAWMRKPVGKVRVAAMGWVTNRPRLPTEEIWQKRYLPMLHEATRAGARLVVSPETGFKLSPGERTSILERLSGLAREKSVMLAFGYFHRGESDNRIAFVGPAGELLAEYQKTHLIAGMERYRAGTGEPVLLELDGRTLGGMICQDDNFTDISRDYGRNQAHLLAVPTNDWRQVKDAHLENSRLRCIESRYGIVRAATNGISAVVSARGEVLASRDHFRQGEGVVTIDLPLYAPGSLYSRVGGWPVIACLAWFVAGLLIWRRKKNVEE